MFELVSGQDEREGAAGRLLDTLTANIINTIVT
jgi:hypothetical protein